MRKQMIMIGQFVLLCSLVLLSGCAITAQKYGASFDNINTLASLKNSKNKLYVPNFTATPSTNTSVMCRAAGPIETPDGKTYAEYIHNALVQELQYAKLYSKDGITLKGHLNSIAFSSMIGDGYWLIRMTFNDGKQKPFTISSKYKFSANFVAGVACTEGANSLQPAVQKFLRKLYRSPQFKQTLGLKSQA